MKKTTVGFAMTGSYCTFEKNLAQMEELVRRGYEVLPILSYNAGELDTRFMTAEHLRERLVSITGHEPIDTLQAAEPLGPKKMTDLYLISPASGNTLAKLVNGIYDTPVLLGAKSHLRVAQRILCSFPSGRPGEKAPFAGGGFCADSENAGFRPVRRAAAAHAGTGKSCREWRNFVTNLQQNAF